jgi:hypothetical protein
MLIVIGSPWIIKHRHRLVAELTLGSMVSGRRQKAKTNKRRSASASRKASEYQCVTIRPCLEACMAAAEQQDRRYLAAEVPDLPLSGCDSGECYCRYQYHEDRRENENRRFSLTQFNAIESRTGGHERRSPEKVDRRKSTEKAEPPSYFNDY